MAVLNEEQRMLRDAAEAWVRDRAPVTALRALRQGTPAPGHDPALYAEMAEMGWTGILAGEDHGGSDLGLLTMGIVAEQLGRHLVTSPLVSSGVGAVSALRLGGAPVLADEWLPAIVEGRAVLALAIDEGPRHDPAAPGLTAAREGGGWRLSGAKRPVINGLAAHAFLVSAATPDGVALFLVDAGAPGLTIAPLKEIDVRGAALCHFDGVMVAEDARLSTPGLLDGVLDRVRAVVAAEMLGTAAQAFDTTLDYLKTRMQFGQIIGRFQALQHRAAALYGELELTRSAVEAALAALDDAAPDAASLVSVAKALAGDLVRRMGAEMIQLHGGIGMTDEHDAGLYLKRGRVLDMSYGDVAFHRERYALLNGY
ncbi:acyl-CoA dehydrogenase family protein [Niveispirillum sp.]|uniref:acyl-CoA dehydrogenase family protein n=1 Tax=Niveispirillum sp. TaxID=1917217 RepID=UPI001B43B312|nr:acyl-CoA dehydrogenase family protein [Niveispirillum sp.]MBP7336289.1 acyl-CoA dehydrogenase family protein [Niveispirillum sp.]